MSTPNAAPCTARPRSLAVKHGRALVPLAVAVVFVATATSWLTGIGLTEPEVTPPEGLAPGGLVADVVPMTPAISRSIGSAERHSGKPVARLRIAKDFADAVRVTVNWENPLDAAKVLNNPNIQIVLGLYRPVSTTLGACSTIGALPVPDGTTSFCTVQDTGATGSASVDASGRLLLGQGVITGYVEPSIAAPVAAPCAVDAGAPTTWCQPSASLAGADQRVLYVVASITIPGGIPIGHVSATGALSLQVRVQ